MRYQPLFARLITSCRLSGSALAAGTFAAALALVASGVFWPVPSRSYSPVSAAAPAVRTIGKPLPMTGDVALANLTFMPSEADGERILLCQACGPAPCGDGCNARIDGIDCRNGTGCGEQQWDAWGPIPWQAFAQGEYVGPSRLPHVTEYRLRVDDILEFIYVLTRTELGTYQLQVGDSLKVESQIDPNLTRELSILPDGTITLPLLGQVKVSGLTLPETQAIIEQKYKKFYKVTDFTVTATKYNTRLEDLRSAVDSRFFSGGQGRTVRVTPEGTISLPRIGRVPAQGLTLDEVRAEVNERYAQIVDGVEVTPNLSQRAPRYIYVVGEVRNPGRFSLEAPTTAMQSIALAGSWNNGGNLRELIVFRRADDWRLLATKLDLRGALYGERPNPADEIWLRDSDVVVVPKSAIKRTDDLVELIFTNGIYRVFPITFSYGYFTGPGAASTITGS
jgi:polysaccharide export outer membrane protein